MPNRPRPSARPVFIPPSDPAELLDADLDRSGLRAGPVLRRTGRRLGLRTVRDLLFHLPRRYDDLREMRKLGDLVWVEEGTPISATVRVTEIRAEPTFRRRVQRTIARLEDETGTIQATWFGRRYIDRRLHAGDSVVVSGKVKRFGRTLSLDNPEFQVDDGSAVLHAGRIVPIYRLTAGLTATRLRESMREALERAGPGYREYLPQRVIEAEELPGIREALQAAHFPPTFEGRDAALRRLAFDELLALQVGMVARRRQRTLSAGRPIEVGDGIDRELRKALVEGLAERLERTVELTADQSSAMDRIRTDLGAATPMLRLLQGDVGSGKTAVAAFALAVAARAGVQGAILAPTDLLARQHAATIGDLLAPLGIPVALLTGSLGAEATRRALELIAGGMAPVVVGTHALIQERVAFADLGLVVIDEQHRFGVEQRGQLEAKAGRPPHVLLMTATPIPRTLGQVVYADLDVTDLRAAPEGRVAVRTGIRGPDELDGTWRRVRAEAAAGHRTFVVVPLIEESDDEGGAAAAEAEAVRLAAVLDPLRVGLVHGRLRPAERDLEMGRFRDGELDVLVGTTVVEVGVDVPEATVMVILDADRFGLAQLHQLRGRVGRGRAESFCVLVSSSTDETARARLEAVRDLRDGFALAERDFELRREGNVLGLVQSGLPRLRVASLQDPAHRALAVRARGHAEELLDSAGRLRPQAASLERELATGWLHEIADGDPAGTA